MSILNSNLPDAKLLFEWQCFKIPIQNGRHSIKPIVGNWIGRMASGASWRINMVMWYLNWKVIISRTVNNTFQPFYDVKMFAFYQQFKMAAMKMSKNMNFSNLCYMEIKYLKLMELISTTFLNTLLPQVYPYPIYILFRFSKKCNFL